MFLSSYANLQITCKTAPILTHDSVAHHIFQPEKVARRKKDEVEHHCLQVWTTL